MEMVNIYPICRKCKYGKEGSMPKGASTNVGVPFRCSVNGKIENGKCKKFESKI